MKEIEMEWFDKAEDELCNELNKGEITHKDFEEQMRSLLDEMREGAQESAVAAFLDFMR